MNHFPQNLETANYRILWLTAEQIGDVSVIAARVDVKDNNGLRQMMDEMKQKLTQVNSCTWCSGRWESNACLRRDGRFEIQGTIMQVKSSIMLRHNVMEKAEDDQIWQWLVQKMRLNLMMRFNPCMIMSNLFKQLHKSGIIKNGNISIRKTDDLKAGCRSWILTIRR